MSVGLAIITSTFGTFPLYLIKDFDEWGISLGWGILWGVRAVSHLPLCVSSTPALPRSFCCLTVKERESCELPLPGDLRWQARRLGTPVRRYRAKKTPLCNLLHGHVFCISQSCY